MPAPASLECFGVRRHVAALENLATCIRYFERMTKMGMTLEIELGVTGGEEDGADNADVDASSHYTQPEEVGQAYEALRAYDEKRHDCLQTQIGNATGPDAPNKKICDPRAWLGAAEAAFSKRLMTSFEDLNCVGRNA